MNKMKRWSLLLGLCGSLLLGVDVSANMEVPVNQLVYANSSEMSMTREKSSFTGWKETASGKKYYENGKTVKGLYIIGKKTYVFSSKGNLQINKWTLVGDTKYCSDSKGVLVRNHLVKRNGYYYYVKADGTALKNSWKKLDAGKTCYFGSNGRRYTGVHTIAGKTYGFSKNAGYLLKNSWIKLGSKLYRTNASGEILKDRILEIEGKYYFFTPDGSVENGKAMTEAQVRNYQTLEIAKRIAGQITNSTMSKEAKLRACFEWVIKKPYVTRRAFSNFDGWPAVFANDHFLLGGGNCHSDASAFAYLAKAIGYEDIYVCTDSDGNHGDAHSWCEIGGRVYDPLFAEAKKNYAIYYGGTYAAYRLSPILHIAI